MLLDTGADASRPTAWPVARRRLDQACRDAGGQLLTPDDAKTFIREYMRVLFTGRRTSDPERFVRTFVAAFSFTDIASVEQFVRRYLLEPQPIDIAELRGSIRRYREIQKTIADLNRRLEALRAIRAHIEEFDRLLAEELTCRAIERTALLVEGFARLLTNVNEQRSRARELHIVTEDFARVEEEIEREIEALASVQRQLAATGAQGQRAIVEQEIRGLERDHVGVTERLLARHLSAARAIQLLDLRDRLSVINPGELFRALERVEEASRGLAPPDWPRDPAEMEELPEAVSEAASARTETATDQRDEAIVWVKRLEAETAEDRQTGTDHP
jgi:hypothetical protein